MQLSWGRGFFRIWTVLAIIWVTFFGWREYSIQWWWAAPSSGDCWDRLAKWYDAMARFQLPRCRRFHLRGRSGWLDYEAKAAIPGPFEAIRRC